MDVIGTYNANARRAQGFRIAKFTRDFHRFRKRSGRTRNGNAVYTIAAMLSGVSAGRRKIVARGGFSRHSTTRADVKRTLLRRTRVCMTFCKRVRIARSPYVFTKSISIVSNDITYWSAD